MKRPSGFVLYEGPSVLDGQPIVCIATMRTDNPKTGPMVQTWILRQDLSPVDVVKAGADASVCGHCPQRHHTGGACYVPVHRGPGSVWKAYRRGNYSHDWRPETFRNLLVRLGAYGDPAAVPVEIWDSVLCWAGGWTGHTHQAHHPEFDSRILDWCMASVDTPMQAIRARAEGRRTFRIKTPEQPLMAGEILCPATGEGTATCATCGICSGARLPWAPSVAIDVHGGLAKRFIDKFAGARIPAREVA